MSKSLHTLLVRDEITHNKYHISELKIIEKQCSKLNR